MCNPFRLGWMLFMLLVTTSAFCQPSQTVIASVDGNLRQLDISTAVTTMLIFSAPICEEGIDRGNPDIVTSRVAGVANVLRVKAYSDKLAPSNLTVFTTDGKIYSFSVQYVQTPVQTVFDFTVDKAGSRAIFARERLNDAAVTENCKVVSATAPSRRRPKSNRIGGMRARISSVYQNQGVLFFKVTVANSSALDYDLNFVRCYIRDRRQRKRTSSMEKQLQPLEIMYRPEKKAAAGSEMSIVIALDKFTIADEKLFCLELFETNGDRVLLLKLKGDHLLSARTL